MKESRIAENTKKRNDPFLQFVHRYVLIGLAKSPHMRLLCPQQRQNHLRGLI